MKIGKNGIELIKHFEGCKLQSYDDANNKTINSGDNVRGVLTIGIGHTSAAGSPEVFPGMKITEKEAEEILDKDLDKVETDVNRLVKVPLTQNQFDALVSFHFNTGALGRSSALKSLNSNNYETAAKQLLWWNKAKQIGPGPIPGLVRRREAEKKLFLTPDTPEQTQGQSMPSLPFPLNIFFSFINPDKIGGWVRAAVGPVITVAFAWATAKLPFLSEILTPELGASIGASLGLAVTGLLSNISKGNKVAELKAALPSDKVLDHSRKD